MVVPWLSPEVSLIETAFPQTKLDNCQTQTFHGMDVHGCKKDT